MLLFSTHQKTGHETKFGHGIHLANSNHADSQPPNNGSLFRQLLVIRICDLQCFKTSAFCLSPMQGTCITVLYDPFSTVMWLVCT